MKPAVMGVLNVTPDSFYNGGKYFKLKDALQRAREIAADGADMVDIGGESTRPGSEPISKDEELERVIPVIEKIKSDIDIKISCDTSKSEVAEAALKAGADMINDVCGFGDPKMRKVAAEYNASICIMHMEGTPQTMQENPVYGDVLSEIKEFLHKRASLCEEDGISHQNIVIDPGIGFGKTLEHNLEIIANIKYFTDKYPVLVGASRKSFLGAILNAPVDGRLAGSISVSCWLSLQGVKILRVHDVKETKDAIKIIQKIKHFKDD